MRGMIEELSNLMGVSGNENAVRQCIMQHIKPYATDITVDTMGNVIAYKKGRAGYKNIMITAHMDEVGFIITHITDDGYLKFQTVGGIDPKILVSKHVVVGQEFVNGVIGIKAIHLQNKEERGGKISLRNLYIDIGCQTKAEAEEKVHIGDYAGFAPRYTTMGDHIVSKALDDRVGCALLVELMKEEYDPNIYFSFTVQEEVGLRGARVAAHCIRPDYTIALETTTCNDTPDIKEHEFSTRYGKGAVLTLIDGASMSDKDMVLELYRRAKEQGIMVQYKTLARGGNDTGAMQTAAGGAKSISLSIPCKYIHSPVCMAHKEDINALYEIAKVCMKEVCK